jgi:two-component system LytT family response regulator
MYRDNCYSVSFRNHADCSIANTPVATIRTLIIDDEPLARRGIRSLLEQDPEIEIIGECADGVEAVEEIQRSSPDLIFLDVQMPEVNGFDVIEALRSLRIPDIIFVTAFDRYAIEAFKVHALDYLLKPVDADRFRTALDHAKASIHSKHDHLIGEKLLNLVNDLKKEQHSSSRIVIKSNGRIMFLNIREIDWIEASGDYITIHARKEKHLLREKISAIESKLDAKMFIRIHRSTIVNAERIKELRPKFRGEYTVNLIDGTLLTMSRSYRNRLNSLFDKKL